MKNQRISQRVSNIVGFVRAVIAGVSLLTPPRGLTPVPVPVRRRCGPIGWLASSRCTGWLPLLVGFVLLTAMPVWASAAALPEGVPNIFDPSVQAHFQPVAMTNLQDNPDFPVVLLLNTTGQEPQTLLLGFDARNGKDTWSLTTDPIILIVVFADATRVQGVYVDTGFAGQGKASGTYAAVDKANGSALPDLLKAVAATGKQNKI
jgi:hypothetical protein